MRQGPHRHTTAERERPDRSPRGGSMQPRPDSQVVLAPRNQHQHPRQRESPMLGRGSRLAVLAFARFGSFFARICGFLLQDGWTAMMWAAAIGSADCLRELLAYEADRRIQSRDGVTAQDYARRHKQVDSSAAFLEREEFLAKLGSRTKPALREAVRSIGQAHAEESQPIQVIILDQGQGAVEDNTAQPTTEEAVSGGAEDAVAQTNACAQDSHADHHGQLQAHHQPVPVLDLGNLDFELPD
eukprot:m.173442 g.173442  ORF g.173442 m.173442 type:complete len:242 (-) comp53271_c0_seq1:100-825(-)